MNTGTNDENFVILFHTFPKEPNQQLLWTVAIRRDVKEGEFNVRRDTCVCSNHFEETYYVGGKKVKGARLRSDSVPSIFSWTKQAPKRRVLVRNTEVPVVSTCQTHVEWLQEQLEAESKM